MNTEAFLDRLFARAGAAGFQASEAYMVSGESFEVSVLEGEIREYGVSSAMGLGFRGLLNGKMGYASTQALDEDAAEMLVEGAKTNALLIENADPQTIFAGGGDYHWPEARSPALDALSAREKIDKALALERAVLSIDPAIQKLDECGVSYSLSKTRLINSRGLDLAFERNGACLYAAPIARQNGEVNTGMEFVYGRDFSAMDEKALSRAAAREALSGLGARPVASGDYEIALRNDAAAALVRAFGSVFSADAAQKGLSLLKGREGTRIASDALTIWDDPEGALGYAPRAFDGEGVPCRKKAVVEGGVLTTLLHNLKTAAKQGVETTGNAYRASYGSPVAIAPANFLIAPGARSRDALLSDMNSGLFITDLMGLHAGVNAVNGDFSLGAKGFLVENGRALQPVNGITVAGNFFSLLQNVRAVAGDLRFGLPVGGSYGSPTLWVGRLTVAGK